MFPVIILYYEIIINNPKMLIFQPLQSLSEVQAMQAQVQGLITDLKDAEQRNILIEQTINRHKER